MASKIELIKWVNDNFKANVQSLEQLVNGQLFCQIFEYLHPNSIPSNKVNWRASQEIDYIKNFKLLADAFHKANMSKSFDVNDLFFITRFNLSPRGSIKTYWTLLNF